MKNKLIYLAIPILLLAAVPSVYASGPRFDSPEYGTEDQIACYREGWEQGFAGIYDNERASECYETGLDWYNKIWTDACTQTRSDDKCDDIRNDPVNVQESDEELGEQNRRYCYDLGYEDGQNNPFNQDLSAGCEDYSGMYYQGFIAGCIAIDNTKEVCESATDV
jgi:hypothetical protein